jgi:alpha-beta hydrolase superfamily lysophospholipase
MIFCRKHIITFLFLLLIVFGVKIVEAQRNLQLSFPSGNLILNGTLTLPAGSGPFPLLLLVHGSGPQTRNVTTPLIGGNFPCLYPGIHGNTVQPFKELREGLAQRGFAVFSYDKRTFTYAAVLDQTRITVFDYAEDAGAALDFLKTRSEVDTSCIAVLGHSQGGCVTAWLARQRDDIHALISLAGPATSIDTLVGEQLRYIYPTCDDSLTGVNVANQMQAAFGSIRNGTWPPLTPLSGAYPNFWSSWMQLADSVVENYNIANKPVLFIHGDDDYNVPVRDTARWLNEINLARFDVEVLAGLNHFLTPANSPNLSADVIQAIDNWLPICRTTSIQETNAGNQIQAIRRPDQLLISLKEMSGPVLIKLFDMSGRLLFQKNDLISTDQFTAIPISQEQFFILEISNNKGFIFRKKL